MLYGQGLFARNRNYYVFTIKPSEEQTSCLPDTNFPNYNKQLLYVTCIVFDDFANIGTKR